MNQTTPSRRLTTLALLLLLPALGACGGDATSAPPGDATSVSADAGAQSADALGQDAALDDDAAVTADAAPAVDAAPAGDTTVDATPRPTGRVGVPCESTAPCTEQLRFTRLTMGAAGQATCDDGLVCIPSSCDGVNTGYPGGYCTRPCESDDDCPWNTGCVLVGVGGFFGQARCHARCLTDCRPGWTCEDEFCVPEDHHGDVPASEACSSAGWTGCFDRPGESVAAPFAGDLALPTDSGNMRTTWAERDGAGGLWIRGNGDCFTHVPANDPAGGEYMCVDLPTPGVDDDDQTTTPLRRVALAFDRAADPTKRYVVWTDTWGEYGEGLEWIPTQGTTHVVELGDDGAPVGNPLQLSARNEIAYDAPSVAVTEGHMTVLYRVYAGSGSSPTDARTADVRAECGELVKMGGSVPVADEGGRAREAVMLLDDTGRPFVFYRGRLETGGDTIRVRWRSDEGFTFEPSVPLTPDVPIVVGYTSGAWAAAVSPAGDRFAAAWTEPLRDAWGSPGVGLQTGASRILAASRSFDGADSAPTPVHPGPDCPTNHKPGIAIDASGRLHVVWETDHFGGPDGAQVLYAASDDGQTWTAPAPVSDAGFPCTLDLFDNVGRRFAVVSGDRLWVAWSDSRSPNQSNRPRAAWLPLQ